MQNFKSTFLGTLAALSVVGIVLIGSSFALAVGADSPNLHKFPSTFAINATRACVYPSGGWTRIDAQNGAAVLSGALNSWTTYAIQCDSDAYVAWGTSAVVTDSADGWLAAGAIVRFATAGGNLYVSVRNKVHVSNDCHYIECK